MSGALSSLFQSGVQPPQPTGSDASTNYPLWLQDYTYNLGSAASNLASSPYSPYPGAQVAAPSAATQQSWNMAQDNVGNYLPALNQAQSLTQQASEPIGAQQINQYMNPYTSNVVGALQQAANTNLTQNQLPAISSQFVGAGQAASPQMAQADNNALYQSNQALDQATSGALQSGYQGALNTALTEQGVEQQTGAQMGQIGALQQQLGAADVGQVAAAGQAQDTTNQANINASMNNFYSQQQWPYQNLAYASNIIRGQPIASNTQQVGLQYAPASAYTPSALSTGLGVAQGASALSLKAGGSVKRPRGGALNLHARAA